jgi:hypothetical protein
VVTALLPVGDPRVAPAAVAGQRFWELPTGARISWVRVPAEGPRRPTSVVFLHGRPPGPRPGPGTASRPTTKGHPSAGPGRLRRGHRRLVALTAMAAAISTAITKMIRTAGSTRPPQVPMATGRPATARSRAVIPAQPGVEAAAAGE